MFVVCFLLFRFSNCSIFAFPTAQLLNCAVCAALLLHSPTHLSPSSSQGSPPLHGRIPVTYHEELPFALAHFSSANDRQELPARPESPEPHFRFMMTGSPRLAMASLSGVELAAETKEPTVPVPGATAPIDEQQQQQQQQPRPARLHIRRHSFDDAEAEDQQQPDADENCDDMDEQQDQRPATAPAGAAPSDDLIAEAEKAIHEVENDAAQQTMAARPVSPTAPRVLPALTKAPFVRGPSSRSPLHKLEPVPKRDPVFLCPTTFTHFSKPRLLRKYDEIDSDPRLALRAKQVQVRRPLTAPLPSVNEAVLPRDREPLPPPSPSKNRPFIPPLPLAKLGLQL